MNKIKEFFKFILWLGLILGVLLAVIAVGLPIAIITSDYAAGIPFPIGYTVTASILAVLTLAVFCYSLRRIEANPTKIKTSRAKKTIDTVETENEAEIPVQIPPRIRIEPKVIYPQFNAQFGQTSTRTNNVVAIKEDNTPKRRRI